MTKKSSEAKHIKTVEIKSRKRSRETMARVAISRDSFSFNYSRSLREILILEIFKNKTKTYVHVFDFCSFLNTI